MEKPSADGKGHKVDTNAILKHADAMRVMAAQLEQIAEDFDKSGVQCNCCKAFRYNNFPQRQLREKIEGAAERLAEIVATLQRRRDDPIFIHGIPVKGEAT